MADKKKDAGKNVAVQEIIGPDKNLEPGGPGGENAHVPTEANRLLVKIMVSCGRPQDEIASVLKIAPKTLRSRYRDELDQAMGVVAGMVLGKLYKKIAEEETAAILFFCKTRLGMKETTQHEFPNGIPLAGDSSAVTDERTKQLIQEALNDL